MDPELQKLQDLQNIFSSKMTVEEQRDWLLAQNSYLSAALGIRAAGAMAEEASS